MNYQGKLSSVFKIRLYRRTHPETVPQTVSVPRTELFYPLDYQGVGNTVSYSDIICYMENENIAIHALMEQNAELLKENNRLLKKIHRNGVMGFWARIIWYVILVGLPFALYFYILEPYFTALGSNYEVFKAGINEIPGLKGLDLLLNSLQQK